MRIGIIEIKKLVTVRETFRPVWRISLALIFLVFVYSWWGSINKAKGFTVLVTDHNLRPRTLALVGVVVLVFAVMLFRKGDFARLFYVLIAGFISLMLFFLLIMIIGALIGFQNGPGIILALGGVLIALLLCWKLLIQRMYALCQSLIPLNRWKAYRQQVNNSLRLWSGYWKGLDTRQKLGASGERARRWRGHFNLTLAVLAFVLGSLSLLIALIGLINRDFIQAIYAKVFPKAWNILLNLEIQPPGPWSDILYLLPFLFISYLSFGLFGYCWNRWKRGKITIYETSLAEHMTPSSLLLLRSFDDDIKYVPGRPQTLLTLPFRIYEWGFTFEQLIEGRLACVGELRLLARSTKGNPKNEDDEDSKNNRSSHSFSRKVKSNVKSTLAEIGRMAKSSNLPPIGGIRHQIDDQQWEEEILKAMPIARMIVVLLGLTKNLRWEMDEIKRGGFLRKSVFLMPPLASSKNRHKRWEEFIEYLCETEACKVALLKQVDPKRILAVCFHENDLVLITGESNQLSNESALDVATVITIATPTQSSVMIPKYLNIETG